jgi:arginyl-tRNA synthetase
VPGLIATVDAVLARAFAQFKPGAPSALRPSQHADLQVDGCLALARQLGRPPREVAEEVLAAARAAGLDEVCESAHVAGPGFINLVLSADFLARQLAALAAAPGSLGVVPASPQAKFVVDYAGPNAAKEMHVGHLRSAIIGDCLVRLLSQAGHEVVRENHIGDWGANFGMLLEHLVDVGEEDAAHELAVGDLEAFYQAARAAYETNPDFAERARARVVRLQSGEPETLRLWRAFVGHSITYFDEALRRLGTKLTRDDVVGESFYNGLLPAVVEDLAKLGLLVESDGALCVFPPGFTNREGNPLPLIVQNSVGGYNYATTDLAALRDRVDRLGAQVLLYVVGLPQAQHLEMVFATARLAGWLPAGTEAVHVGFGNVLGPDGKMFRTRAGGTVKLAELLDEAVERARAKISERAEQGISEGELERTARAVGIGAVKYSDLSTDRARDYRFDWERMLSFDGNTGPYIQYAHARICSILRKAGSAQGPGPGTADDLRPPRAPQERQLAKGILGFDDAVAASLETYSPHKLCTYLFDLASTFTAFYEHCPVLAAPDEATRTARLALCRLTATVLRGGLDLLGIEAPERM